MTTIPVQKIIIIGLKNVPNALYTNVSRGALDAIIV